MASNNSICSYDVKNNLRAMIGYRYDSDHDFYEQLKKAIYYDGETYIGVCERLIELIGNCCSQYQHKPDAKREAAAGWVEEQGGLDVVADFAKMDEFAAHLAVDLGVSDDVGCGDELRDAITAVIDEYRKTLVKIGCLLGYDDGDLPMLPEFLLGELDKRLMPHGMEWLRYEDGVFVLPSDKGIIGIEYSKTGNTVIVTSNDDEPRVVYAKGERVKRLEPEVLGADGLPLKVGDTVYRVYKGGSAKVVKSITYVNNFCKINYESFGWDIPEVLTHTPPDTQERINDDVCKISDACTYFSSDGSCAKCRFVSQYGDADSAYAACPDGVELERMAILDLLRRQRELCAKGGE